MRVCVLGDPGGLGRTIGWEFDVSATGLDDMPPPDCDGVVLVVGADPPPDRRALTDLPETQWREAAEVAPLRVMRALVRARTAALPKRGHIIVVTPNVGLVGAPDLAHYVTGIEAIRAIAKSAARQWAVDGISVSLVVVPLGLIVSAADDLVPHIGKAVRGDADLLDAVVRAVHFLLSGAGPGLTGSTLVVDGGAVMVP